MSTTRSFTIPNAVEMNELGFLWRIFGICGDPGDPEDPGDPGDPLSGTSERIFESGGSHRVLIDEERSRKRSENETLMKNRSGTVNMQMRGYANENMQKTVTGESQ